MGNIDVKSLITEEVDLKDYEKIYGDMRKHGSIAFILKYPVDAKRNTIVEVASADFQQQKDK